MFSRQCFENDDRSHGNGRSAENDVVSMPGHQRVLLAVCNENHGYREQTRYKH